MKTTRAASLSGRIAGFRAAYTAAGTLEDSIYVHHDFHRRKIGSRLLAASIAAARSTSISYLRFGMITSALASSPTAVSVEVSDEELTVSLSDGRVVRVPLSWYARLSNALPEHRAIWELLGGGHGIHWPEQDEDISVENVLLGQPSGESAHSFAKWKEWYRQKAAGQAAAPNGCPGSTPFPPQNQVRGQ